MYRQFSFVATVGHHSGTICVLSSGLPLRVTDFKEERTSSCFVAPLICSRRSCVTGKYWAMYTVSNSELGLSLGVSGNQAPLRVSDIVCCFPCLYIISTSYARVLIGMHSSPNPHPLRMHELEPLCLRAEVENELGNLPWPENMQDLFVCWSLHF